MSQVPGRQSQRPHHPAAMAGEVEPKAAEDPTSAPAPYRDTPETARCACSHLLVVHQLVVRKSGTSRGVCTHQDANGRCPCRSPR